MRGAGQIAEGRGVSVSLENARPCSVPEQPPPGYYSEEDEDAAVDAAYADVVCRECGDLTGELIDGVCDNCRHIEDFEDG